jgi:chromosome segregation ATPase
MDNISIEAHQVLQVIANAMSRTPDVSPRIIEVLKLILNPEGYLPSDVEAAIEPLRVRLDQSLANQQTLIQRIGELMARADEHAARLGGAIDANTAQAAKAFTEIRAALDAALEAQITQEELDAAVAAARTAAAEEANAANQAALDAAFEPLQSKLDAQKTALQQLDDVVPDAPPVEPPVEPTPTPAEPV